MAMRYRAAEPDETSTISSISTGMLKRQLVRADSAPRVSARLAEDLDEEIGGAVDHRWLPREPWRAVDPSDELHDAGYAFTDPIFGRRTASELRVVARAGASFRPKMSVPGVRQFRDAQKSGGSRSANCSNATVSKTLCRRHDR
jgi:hypothetical protein